MSYLLPDGMGLLNGDFGNGFYAMAGLLGGDFWCLTGDEIYLVYRDNGAGTFDYTMPCEMYLDGATTESIAYQILDSDTWQYTQCALSIAGSISDASNVCTVRVNGSGVADYQPGNEPSIQAATAIGSGKIRIDWHYDFTNQPATPTGFKVYQKEGAGGSFALARTEPYVSGKTRYTWTTAALSNGIVYYYYVRTYRTVEIEEVPTDFETQNTTAVNATADTTGPSVVATIAAVVV